jgi:hypothetical protein
MVEGITGLPSLPCLNTSAVCLEVFSDLACGEKSSGSQEYDTLRDQKEGQWRPSEDLLRPEIGKTLG